MPQGGHLHCFRLNQSCTNLRWVAVQGRAHEGTEENAGERGRLRREEEKRGQENQGKQGTGDVSRFFCFFMCLFVWLFFAGVYSFIMFIVDVYVCWREEAAKKAGERENRGTQHGQENGGAVFEKRALMR